MKKKATEKACRAYLRASKIKKRDPRFRQIAGVYKVFPPEPPKV